MFVLFGCDGKKSSEEFKTLTQEEINAKIQKVQELPDVPVTENEKAVIHTTMGTIEFELLEEVAPNHCANFKKLANAGFYDGVTFHRVIPGFVIQGGDIRSRDDNPANDGTGDAGYSLDAEFSDLHHDRGMVSTARSPHDINSAGTQFFICVKDIRHLDGQYTIFGEVTKGMDVVDKIVAVPRDNRDRPLENVVMTKVRVVEK
ncbi:peptidylprolyl isomerase [candidate division KSB1 bacterium]|nr:peptidylprolyl isomerase [candidate division KSB1 bacterium]